MNLEERDLRIDTKFIRSILVNFVQTEVSRADYERAVIALSGGVDSSLSCAIAVEALGPDNVLGVRIPYKSSSPDSLDHAQLVIDWLKIPALTLPITDLVDPLIEEIPDISRIRKGNILQLPNYSLEVVAACSGLHSLMTMITLAIVLAAFISTTRVRKVILVALAVPAAVAANTVRLVVTGIGAYAGGPGIAEGTLHEISGLIVFFAGFLFLLAAAAILRWKR